MAVTHAYPVILLTKDSEINLLIPSWVYSKVSFSMPFLVERKEKAIDKRSLNDFDALEELRQEMYDLQRLWLEL